MSDHLFCASFWPLSSSAVIWSTFWQIYLFWPIRIEYDTARQLSTIKFCFYQFAVDTSVFVIGMGFAQRYMNIRRSIYVYIYKYKYFIFCKRRWGILSSNLFNESFVSFDLQIGATGIPVFPSFAYRSWLCRLGRHRRQPAIHTVWKKFLCL